MKNFVSIAFFIAVLSISTAQLTYPLSIPNGDASMRMSSGLSCLYLGHTDCSLKAPLNEFGEDLESVGGVWNREICEADSDGDGFTNGQELGDPCCQHGTLSREFIRSNMLSHPGDAKSINIAPPVVCPSERQSIRTCASTFSAQNHLKCGRVIKKKFNVANSKIPSGGNTDVVLRASLKRGILKFKVLTDPNVLRVVRYDVRADTQNSQRMRTKPILKRLKAAKTKFKGNTKLSVLKMPVPAGRSSCCGRNVIFVRLSIRYCLDFDDVKDECTDGSTKYETSFTAKGKIKCGPVCTGPGIPVPMSLSQKCPQCDPPAA